MLYRVTLWLAVAALVHASSAFQLKPHSTWARRGLTRVAGEDLSTSGEAVESNLPDVTLRRLEELEINGLELEPGETAHKFWIKMTQSGKTTTKYMRDLERDAAKNAQFPGFRKGKVPPFIMNELRRFCLETVMNDGIMDCLEDAKITPLEGDYKHAEIEESVDDMFQTFKVGNPVTFTATVHGKISTPVSALGSAVDATMIDAEVVSEVAEEVARGDA